MVTATGNKLVIDVANGTIKMKCCLWRKRIRTVMDSLATRVPEANLCRRYSREFNKEADERLHNQSLDLLFAQEGFCGYIGETGRNLCALPARAEPRGDRLRGGARPPGAGRHE